MTRASPSPMIGYFRGRVALKEALVACGVKPGDEVLLQGYTCLAVALPIAILGAKPVFVDISPDTLGISPADLRRKATNRTRAVVIQHTFGVEPELEEARRIASDRGIAVIADRCHCLFDPDEPVQDDFEFYSFEWGKPMTGGVGGGLRLGPGREALLQKVLLAREGFSAPSVRSRLMIDAQYSAFRWLLTGGTYWSLRRLYNALKKLGVGVGTFSEEELDLEESDEYKWLISPSVERRVHRLARRVGEIRQHHREIAARYQEWVSELGLACPEAFSSPGLSPMRFPLWVREKDRLLRKAQADRVEMTGMFRQVVDPLEVGQVQKLGYDHGSCPAAEGAVKGLVSLPVHQRVSEAQLERTHRFLLKNRAQFLDAAETKYSGTENRASSEGRHSA